MNKKLLHIDYGALTNEQILTTIKEITMRLYKYFKKHIGYENATHPSNIFENVTGVNPEILTIYEREYWWGIIKKVMRHLRSNEELFIIHRGQKWFVLKNVNEARQYCQMLDHTIIALEKSKTKAKRWVRKQSWQNI